MIRLEEEDFFPLDNNRTISLLAPPSKKFGFWFDDTNNPETIEESEFLRNAVLSAGGSSWDRWETKQENADGIRLGDPQGALELLMILGIESWFNDENLGPKLLDFLTTGGSAFVTPGRRFSSTASIFKQNNLMDFSFLRVAGGANLNSIPFRIATLETSSSLGEVFSGKSARDLYLTAIRRFGILNNLGQDLQVPLRDRQGRPLVVIRNFETGGRLVFLTFRFCQTWTDLPLRNSFLPLLMELTKSSVYGSNSSTRTTLEPGEKFGNKETFYAEIPGVFRFKDQVVEVVLSPVESSPDVFGTKEIVQALGGESKVLSSQDSGVGLLQDSARSLWLWFAIAATILLIIEMLWSRPFLDTAENPKTSHA